MLYMSDMGFGYCSIYLNTAVKASSLLLWEKNYSHAGGSFCINDDKSSLTDCY
jgi:hypothetical protein